MAPWDTDPATGRALFFDRRGTPIGLFAYALLTNDWQYVNVAQAVIGGHRVSTVWTGLTHDPEAAVPLVFETMIRSGDGRPVPWYRDRYPDEAAALAGHERAVAWLRARLARSHDPGCGGDCARKGDDARLRPPGISGAT